MRNEKPITFIKILPKQVCYKIENGEAAEIPLRLGRLDGELYRDRKVIINTIFGETSFIPKVEVQAFTYYDDKSYIVINIYNVEAKVTAKQFIIRSQPNSLSLIKMKELYDEIITLLNKESDTTIIELAELINKKEITFEEYC